MQSVFSESPFSLTLILPFHSDGERIAKILPMLESGLSAGLFKEVILSHNGRALAALPFPLPAHFRLIHTDEAGIGAGYAEGIKAAQTEWILLSASDLPFGFTDIKMALKDRLQADLYLGSKLHPDSRIEGHGSIRILCSYLFYLWRRAFLGPQAPRDSQGTILVRTDLARALLQQTQKRDFFFSVEFVYRAQSKKLTLKEVPVELENATKDSSVHLFRDGFLLFSRIARMGLSSFFEGK